MKTDYFIRVVVFIVAISLFSVGLITSVHGDTVISGVNYGAAFLCLIFVYISKFSKFKGFGIEAELQNKINQADEALCRLRKITLPMAKMLFELVSRQGRYSGPIPRKEQYEIVKEIEIELIGNGVEPDLIERAKENWHRINLMDMASPVLISLENHLCAESDRRYKLIEGKYGSHVKADDIDNHRQSVEYWREVEAEREAIKEIYNISLNENIYDRLLSAIKTSNILTQENKDEILKGKKNEMDDLKFYCEKKRFRRLDHWFYGGL